MGRENKRTRLDRLGPDEGVNIGSWGWAAYVFPPFTLAGFFGAYKLGLPLWAGLLMAVACGAGASYAVVTIPRLLGEGAGSFLGFMVMGGDRGRGEDTFSIEESLLMRGLVAEAVARFDERMAAEPDFVALRVRAAELHAGVAGNPERAAELFREVQSHPRATAADEIFASNRLVDLYLGPLQDPGRALVELRRVTVRHPGSRAAVHAREGIRTLKAEMGTQQT